MKDVLRLFSIKIQSFQRNPLFPNTDFTTALNPCPCEFTMLTNFLFGLKVSCVWFIFFLHNFCCNYIKASASLH